MPIADPGAGAATPAPPLSVDDQFERLTDGEGIINPLSFPEPSVSVEYVNAMASGLREVGTSIADTGNDITGSWAGLNGPYSAPEAETLFSVLDPVATDGDTVGEELDRAARALENFAEDVADIKTRWSYLRTLAYDLRSRIDAEGDDWDKGGGFAGFGEAPLKEENDGLVEQGREIVNDYTEVENTCANAINAGISGRTSFEKQPEGDAELDPNVFYHGFDQDLSELAQAWGHESAQTDHPWWVDAGHAVWDFGVDAVEGVGAMVGAHSSQGWFEASWGDALKEYHWDNLTSAASLVGMYDAETDSLGPAGWDAVGQAWKDLAHSVVPWEEWGDRPGYVIGTAALNVIGLVGGAALTATGVGAVVGVPLMAWRGMSIVDGMGGSGRGGSGGGADIDLPDVSHIPQFGGSGSPLINLAGRALDATGYGPSQWADLKNMVNRLMPSGQSGTGSAGAGSAHTGGEAEGGRPGSARPTPVSDDVDQRPIQRPVQDPMVADALAFDDIVNHPDNQAFGEQARSTRQGQIDEVDQAAKTGSNGTPASEEGRWTGGAGEGRGPDKDAGKVPEMSGGGRPSDTMDASAAKNPPASAERVRLTDINGPSGNRPFGNEVAESRGDHGADMRDRNPTARNHNGDDSKPNRDGSSQNDSHGIRDDRKSAGSEERSSTRNPTLPVTPTSDVPNTGDSSTHVDQGPKDRDDPDIGQDDQGNGPSNRESEIGQQSTSDVEGVIEDITSESEGGHARDRPFAERYGLDTRNGEFSEASKPLPTLDRSKISEATVKGRILGIMPDSIIDSRNQKGEVMTVVRPDGSKVYFEKWLQELNTDRTREINEYREENLSKERKRRGEPMVSMKDLGGKKGAVNGIVVDRINGIVAEGMNGDRDSILDRTMMNSKIQRRIDEMTITKERAEKENRSQYQMYDVSGKAMEGDEAFHPTPHRDTPGRHAEIKASSVIMDYLDQLSRDFPDKNIRAEIDQLHADVRFTFKKGQDSLNCPFCANCNHVLSDAHDPLSGRMNHDKNNPDLKPPIYQDPPSMPNERS